MKKQSFIIMYLTIILLCVFADDTHIQMGIGGIEYFDSEDENISLSNEILTIHLNDNNVDYKIEFEFYNAGKAVEYNIGFPVYFDAGYDKSLSYEKNIPIKSFETSVNGINVDFIKKVEKLPNGVVAWYVKKVIFPENSITRVNVEYQSNYGRYGGYPFSIYTVNYFYGSANTWKNKISTFRIIVINNSDKYICNFSNVLINQIKPEYKVIGQETTEILYSSIKPDKNSQINIEMITIENISGFGDDVNADTKNYKIEKEDILFYNSKQLRFLRNLYYAMNGYIFKNNELKDFFNKTLKYYKKYNPQFTNVDDRFNDIEKESIKVIQDLENERQK